MPSSAMMKNRTMTNDGKLDRRSHHAQGRRDHRAGVPREVREDRHLRLAVARAAP